MQPKPTTELIELLKTKKYSHVIFDFDETICKLLIDWSGWRKRFQEWTKSLGEELDSTHTGVHKSIEFLIEKYGAEAREKINNLFLQSETEDLKGIDVNRILVEYLKSGTTHSNYILSNNMTATIDIQLANLGITECFEEIYGRDKVEVSKPSPEPINHIVEKAGVTKAAVLMVGDNPGSDILAAERAGVDSFLIDMYAGN